MDIAAASLVLGRLQSGERRIMYTSPKGVQITATQTGKFSPHDFAVGLVIPGRPEFYPTHVRLLFDYYLKRVSEPQQAQKLFEAVEKVYEGNTPEELAQDVGTLTFPMQLDEAIVNLIYTQLPLLTFTLAPLALKDRATFISLSLPYSY